MNLHNLVVTLIQFTNAYTQRNYLKSLIQICIIHKYVHDVNYERVQKGGMLKDDITICIYMSDYMAYVYTVHCQASLDVEYDVSPIRNGVPTPPTFPTCPVTMVTRDSMSNLFLGQHQRRHQIAPDVRGLEAGQESSVEFVHFVLAQGTVGSAQIHGQPLHVGHLGKAWSH